MTRSAKALHQVLVDLGLIDPTQVPYIRIRRTHIGHGEKAHGTFVWNADEGPGRVPIAGSQFPVACILFAFRRPGGKVEVSRYSCQWELDADAESFRLWFDEQQAAAVRREARRVEEWRRSIDLQKQREQTPEGRAFRERMDAARRRAWGFD